MMGAGAALCLRLGSFPWKGRRVGHVCSRAAHPPFPPLLLPFLLLFPTLPSHRTLLPHSLPGDLPAHRGGGGGGGGGSGGEGEGEEEELQEQPGEGGKKAEREALSQPLTLETKDEAGKVAPVGFGASPGFPAGVAGESTEDGKGIQDACKDSEKAPGRESKDAVKDSLLMPPPAVKPRGGSGSGGLDASLLGAIQSHSTAPSSHATTNSLSKNLLTQALNRLFGGKVREGGREGGRAGGRARGHGGGS